jgi:hypothetical protein
MNRTLRNVVLAGAVFGLGAAELTGGVFSRSPAPQQAPPPPPAWLATSGQTYRTCYPDRTPTARGVAADDTARPLVWVLDGAGDLRGCTNGMTQANTLAGNAVELAPVGWSHGYRKLLLDQTDWAHARAQGQRLAAAIQERRAAEPHRRLVIVAHSAGCAVALAAGDALPPDTLDRMILLAPSVSTGYDLRPSLRAAREGVDVFSSRRDWVALGFVVRVVGTADRNPGPAAGRRGFQLRTTLAGPETERLRQHFWSPEVSWTGNTGGHHGTLVPAFMQAYLFPLIDGAGGSF